jgi:hypothetical protein
MLNRSPGNLEFVMIRRNALMVCHGKPIGVVPENTSSTHDRAFE